MRFNYKITPLTTPHPAFQHETSTWTPILPVRLSYQHSRQTPRIEALLDSGAADTLFRADIGTFLGIKVEEGIKTRTGGIVPGQGIDVYFHDVNIFVGADMVRVRAGFADI